MLVNKDDIPPSLLQMERGGNADNSRTQNQNIGFDQRHSALQPTYRTASPRMSSSGFKYRPSTMQTNRW